VGVAVFAARERVNPNTLAYWRWRLRRQATLPVAAAPPTTTSFVEVVVPPTAGEVTGMEVVLPAGYRVRLGDTVRADTLRTVLDVLEARG
jgi:hypothetical protein